MRSTRSASSSRAELDVRIVEHASKPEFWILAVGIIAFLALTIVSTPKPRGRSAENGAYLLGSEKGNKATEKQLATSHRLQARPYLTAWLAPRIPSRRRQAAAIVVYVTILSLQLLEGKWVLITGFRWLQNYIHVWRSLCSETPYWIHALYAISFLVLLLMVLGTAVVGAVIVTIQVGCIAELGLARPTVEEGASSLDARLTQEGHRGLEPPVGNLS